MSETAEAIYSATRYFDTQEGMEEHATEVRRGARARAEDATDAILRIIRGARHYMPVNSKEAIVELLTREFGK